MSFTMKAVFAATAFAIGAQAAVLRRDASCCFQLTASGGVSGVMGQLGDGQNRVNGSYSPATYCINSAGGITDSNDRGCILTPSVEQFQCDAGVGPTTGFSIASTGQLEYNGDDQFYACPATDTEYNIYTTPVAGQLKCVAITLSTGGQCGSQTSSLASSCDSFTTISATCTPVTQYVTVTVTTSCVASSTASEVISTSLATSVQSTEIGSASASVYSFPSISTSLETYSTPVKSTYVASISTSAYSVQSGTTSTPSTSSPVTSVYGTTDVVSSSPMSSSIVTSITTSSSTQPWSSTVETSSTLNSTPAEYSSVTTRSATSSTQAVEYSSTTTAVATPATSTWSTVAETPSTVSTASTVYSSVMTQSATSYTPIASSTQLTEYTSTTVAVVISTTSTSEDATSASSTTATSYASITTSTSVSEFSDTSTSIQTTLKTYSLSTSIASTTEIASSTTSTSTASTCQTSLTGAYQTPHLIVPISSESPDTAYGTSYYGQVNSTESTIFNFDVPESYADMTCSVIFLFPLKSELETSDYTFNGSGDLVFSELSSVASESTTWNTVPSVSSQLNSISIEEGNSYVVSTASCQAGTTISIELSSASGLNLWFFEDWNPSSLGLFMTAC